MLGRTHINRVQSITSLRRSWEEEMRRLWLSISKNHMSVLPPITSIVPAGIEVVKESKKKKKEKKSIGEVQQELSFKIAPSDIKVESIDTSQWPLLLKVRLCLVSWWKVSHHYPFPWSVKINKLIDRLIKPLHPSELWQTQCADEPLHPAGLWVFTTQTGHRPIHQIRFY